MNYNPQEIEPKWRQHWQDTDLYKVVEDPEKEKFYVLDMFPYPSGAGLHVGHPLGYIATDIYSRYKRMKGYNVLHPMGFDAFGLPAEEYALKTGIHPAESTKKNMERYKEQLSQLGFSYDWSRSVKTCDPDYYKWTQWIFTLLFDHAYDRVQEKPIAIDALTDAFSRQGSEAYDLHTDNAHTFSAEEWNAMNAKEQSEILMDYRLAYRKIGYVNWCAELGTVLANDQVKDGVSERGGYPVEKKPMTQWYLRITAYADRLLSGLDTIDWSESLKTIQSNWIGRSRGAQIFFSVEGQEDTIEIFTTRADTIFGATYMVLAPEHDLVASLTTAEQKKEVEAYIKHVLSKSEIERMAEKEVSGVFLGSYALHPFTHKKIPIWIGEYVLKDYGTGAIMAVPSDDERDHRFAEKYDLPIIPVVDKSDHPDAGMNAKVGKMINSDFLNGLSVPEAIQKAIEVLTEKGIGREKINYKMRDANFSRQRYWGEPFPIVYDDKDIPHAIPLSELPVKLPDTDEFKPSPDGQSPLSRITEWVNEPAPHTRETDVMPAVAGSSWYYLRYMDPHNEEAFASQESLQYWQDVDLYLGGSEHAVAHLMYARFWHKFLHDLGHVPTDEPFKKLINQGMIQGVIESIFLDKRETEGVSRFVDAAGAELEGREHFAKIPVHVDFVNDYGQEDSHLDAQGAEKFLAWRSEYKNAIFEGVHGSASFTDGKVVSKTDGFKLETQSEVGKMSKSLFNVINPDEVIEEYGTDCFRMYEMFLGPIEQSKPWDTQGIDGVSKFLRRFWGLFYDRDGKWKVTDDSPSKESLKTLHQCLKQVNEDIERFSFNTCISAFMICVNELKKQGCTARDILTPLTRAVAPFGPHIAEELWSQLHTDEAPKESVHRSDYPVHEDKYLISASIEYPICINGKKRATIEIDTDLSKDAIEKAALNAEDIQKWIEGKTIKKVILVPNRMINIVV